MLTSPGLASKLGPPGDIFEREEEENYPSELSIDFNKTPR